MLRREFKGVDVPEWRQVIAEIEEFSKEQTPVAADETNSFESWMLSKRGVPGNDANNYLIPASLPRDEDDQGEESSEKVVESHVYLSDCLIVGNRKNQLKFSELTLDMYRIMLSLEREAEPSAMKEGSTPVERAQPHKQLLYKPSVAQVLVGLSNLMKELRTEGSREGAMLAYISADEADASSSTDGEADLGSSQPWSLRGALQLFESDGAASALLYPEDLLSFCRRPFLAIIDSDSANSFRRLPTIVRAPGVEYAYLQTFLSGIFTFFPFSLSFPFPFFFLLLLFFCLLPS